MILNEIYMNWVHTHTKDYSLLKSKDFTHSYFVHVRNSVQRKLTQTLHTFTIVKLLPPWSKIMFRVV